MPGVFRPSSLADVLNVIQQQAVGDTDTSAVGVASFAEANDQVTMADTASASAVAVSPAWGSGEWGAFSWG